MRSFEFRVRGGATAPGGGPAFVLALDRIRLRRRGDFFCFGGWRGLVGRRFFFGDWGYETVSPAGEGFDETRLLRIVFQDLTDFADGAVDAVVGIEKDVFAPDFLGDFFAGDELAFLLNEDDENLQGKALELDDTSGLAEFEGSQIDLEVLPESDKFLRSGRA